MQVTSAGLSIDILFCQVTEGRIHMAPVQWQDVGTLQQAAWEGAGQVWHDDVQVRTKFCKFLHQT